MFQMVTRCGFSQMLVARLTNFVLTVLMPLSYAKTGARPRGARSGNMHSASGWQ